MMKLKPKQYFLELLNKLYDGSITKTELEKLSYFFHNNQELKSWPEHFGSKAEIEERIFSRIQSDIQKASFKESRVIPFYKKSIFKYSVAASVALLISLTYFFNRDNTPSVINPVVADQNIEPGTNKATLTLEDGSVIELDKEHTYQNKNVKSTGNQIVYEVGNKKQTEEIVYNYLTIPRGGEYHIILSDGTEVWLNAESQLKYPVNFIEGKPRQVELVYGEAYFDVSPSTKHEGSKFKVFNQFQEVEVLGTEFNIKAYKDETNIYTTLVEGAVTIDFGDEKQNLLPSQQTNWDTNSSLLSVDSVNVYNEVSWRYGVYSFDGKTLKEIMKILSRWYDVDILFLDNTIEEAQFVGALRRNKNLEEVLMNIKNFGIIKDYEIKNKTVILK